MHIELTAKQRTEGYGKCLTPSCFDITNNRTGYCASCRTVKCAHDGCEEIIKSVGFVKKSFCKKHHFHAKKYRNEKRDYDGTI